MAKGTCSFPECGKPLAGRGYCIGHYQQLKAGKELKPLRLPQARWGGAECTAEETCHEPIVAQGFCGKHYQRNRKHGDTSVVLVGRKPPGPETCSECDQPAHARGYCSSHHARWYKYGDPNFVPPRRERGTCTAIEDGEICGRTMQGNGYCSKHNRRFKVHGDPGIVMPRGGSGHRKYSLDKDYFREITTPEQAYWLGFLTADGSVADDGKHGKSLRLELAEYDAAHLAKFARAIGSDAPVAGPRQGCMRMCFTSYRFVEGLQALGVTARKSLVVAPPLEKLAGLEPYYWRGLWDGDGFVSRRSERGAGWAIGVCGSRACVEGFASWAQQISGSTAEPHNRGSRNPAFWAWAVSGTQKARLLAEQLSLAGPGFGLDRKQAVLDEICAFDFSRYEAEKSARQSAKMRESWASGHHARARRIA